jgi:hypothetical protein
MSAGRAKRDQVAGQALKYLFNYGEKYWIGSYLY